MKLPRTSALLLLWNVWVSMCIDVHQSPNFKWSCYPSKNCNSRQIPHVTRGTIGMMGGALAPAFSCHDNRMYEWLIHRSGNGDAVVLTAGDHKNRHCEDIDLLGYGKFFSERGARRVTTMCLLNENASWDEYVVSEISQAAFTFITDGEQSNYYNYWTRTALSALISNRVASGLMVLAGEGAGLAVHGHWVNVALKGEVTSLEALRNPFADDITLRDDLFSLPILGRTIADSHFKDDGRMGRLLVWLARLFNSSGSNFTGIGIAEHTALMVDIKGANATVMGSGPVNIVSLCSAPERLVPRSPLTATGYKAISLTEGDNYTFVPSPCTSTRSTYTLKVIEGAGPFAKDAQDHCCKDVYICGHPCDSSVSVV